MWSRQLVAAMLILTAAGFAPNPSAGSDTPVETSSNDDLSERVSRLEDRQTAEDRDAAIQRGAAIHRRACAACHAGEGGGDAPGAAELDPWPRDFTAGKYRIRSTLSGEPPRRADVEGTVRRGMPGTSMPGFGSVLSDHEVEDVVTFILSLGSGGLADDEPEALSIPEFPPATATDLSDGRALYLIVGCWKCHGLDGSGRGPSAKGLKTDEGQPVRPRDFRYAPFKGGRSPETVARAALSGLIGTPMPSHAEVLVTPREAIDAYEEGIPAEARPDLDDFRRTALTAAELISLDDDAWEELRDENLISLAHYVLSLSRRGSLAYKLFRQEPELEGRKELLNEE